MDVSVDLYVDTDNNASTGSADFGGTDYVIQLFRGEVNLFKWDGTDFTRRFGDPPATTLIYQWSNGVSIRISSTELGNTKRLRFFAGVTSGIVFDPVTGAPDFGPASADFAPDLARASTRTTSSEAARRHHHLRRNRRHPHQRQRHLRPRLIEALRGCRQKYAFDDYRSIKHIGLTDAVYAVTKALGNPRRLSVACWSTYDSDNVVASSDGLLLQPHGFSAPRLLCASDPSLGGSISPRTVCWGYPAPC